MPPAPTGHRAARVLARDLRPGDLLDTAAGWTPVAGVTRRGDAALVTLVGRTTALRLDATLPVDVCWPVATRTSAQAAELGRGGRWSRPATRTAR